MANKQDEFIAEHGPLIGAIVAAALIGSFFLYLKCGEAGWCWISVIMSALSN